MSAWKDVAEFSKRPKASLTVTSTEPTISRVAVQIWLTTLPAVLVMTSWKVLLAWSSEPVAALTEVSIWP